VEVALVAQAAHVPAAVEGVAAARRARAEAAVTATPVFVNRAGLVRLAMAETAGTAAAGATVAVAAVEAAAIMAEAVAAPARATAVVAAVVRRSRKRRPLMCTPLGEGALTETAVSSSLGRRRYLHRCVEADDEPR
jgi:hypothetical protein